MALTVLKYLNQQFSCTVCTSRHVSLALSPVLKVLCAGLGPSRGWEELLRLQWSPLNAGPPKLDAGMAGEVSRASRAARPGSEAGAANLLSLLLRASVRVVGRLKLGLHSLIIYPGKQGEAGEQRGIQETQRPEALPRSLGARDQLPLWEL